MGEVPDGTVDIINKYADKLAYWVSEPDKGIYDAMNKGIAAASGEWINFMNSGDSFPQEQVLQAIFTNEENTRSEVGVIYGDQISIFSFGRYYQTCQSMNCMDISFPIFHQSTWVRYSLIVSHPFDTSYKIAGDYHQLYNLYKENSVFQYVPLALSVFDAENGISSSRSNQLRMHVEMAKVLNAKISIKVYLVVALNWAKAPVKKLIRKVHPSYFSAQRCEERLLKRNKSLSKLEEKK